MVCPQRSFRDYVSRGRARAVFEFRSDVHFVDLDWANEVDDWRVERSGELLDAPRKRPIQNVEFGTSQPA